MTCAASASSQHQTRPRVPAPSSRSPRPRPDLTSRGLIGARVDEQHCQVWIADLELLRPAHDALLDDVELRRAEAFVHRADRSRFVLGAALVKLAVASETG